MRTMAIAVITILTASTALAADQAPPFMFSPVPRWQVPADQEPETSDVCAAVRKECPGIKDLENIKAEFGYDQIYDIDGQLVGLRLTKSTGCRPLDESMLISERKFKNAFHTPGQSDLDGGLHAELTPGTARDAVHIVKHDSTEMNLGCNPG
ncbi:hypothetical protein [Novosphingobium sp.]|uniref:hypothetical protein n=1 Tax=Novosphingobium sp. TaxID=1874826 RepID=UPI00333E5264